MSYGEERAQGGPGVAPVATGQEQGTHGEPHQPIPILVGLFRELEACATFLHARLTDWDPNTGDIKLPENFFSLREGLRDTEPRTSPIRRTRIEPLPYLVVHALVLFSRVA